MNTLAARHSWALEKIQKAGVRLTPVREAVLALLAAQELPVTWEAVAHAPDLKGRFDATTVFRTLMFLVDLEIARQFHFQERATYFLLNTPGVHCNYLVCRCCGVLTPLPPLEEAHQLERQASAKHGYTALQHEVLVSGYCTVCQRSPHTCSPPTKLLPRGRKSSRHRPVSATATPKPPSK